MTSRNGAGRRLRVLHLIVMLGETNGQYNEHCLPLVGERELAICTAFAPKLQPPPGIRVFAGDGTLSGFMRALRDALAAAEYDAVHAHSPPTGALLLLAVARSRARRRLLGRLVYTVQDSFLDYKWRDRLAMLAVFVAYRRVVFCGHAARASYPRLWRALVGRRVRVIPNAADFARLDRAIAGVPARNGRPAFHIVSVGRVEPVKDPLAVLSAYERLADDRTSLAFIGAGALEAGLDAEIERAGLGGRVERTGLIPRDDVFVRCAGADLFVSASHGEGLPVAVIEAMATGCPVVITDIPPHRELAAGADFVPLVAPGDVEGLAREIGRIRALPAAERRRLGQRCREHVRSRYALDAMHASLTRVYGELR